MPIVLSADSGDVLPDATSGMPIVLSADSEGRVTLDIELEEHYTVETSEECSYDGEKLCLQADTDENGELLPLTERTVKIVPVPTLEVTFAGAPDRIIRLLDPSGTDVTAVAQAGGAIMVERTSSDEPVRLALELEDGYTAEADENAFDNVRFGDGAVEIQDDGDGKAVVQVMERPQIMAISDPQMVTVTLVDEDKYVTRVIGSGYSGSVMDTYEIKQGGWLDLTARPCALDVVGGFVSGKYYSVDDANGDLFVHYTVKSDGSGDMTITTKPDDSAQIPTPIKIEYEDPEKGITSGDNYVLPGGSFLVWLQEGYTISVEGSESVFMNKYESEDYCIVYVNEKTTFVKVTVVAIQQNAKLSATIPDAVESTDIYGMSEELGRDYVGNGEEMAGGKGWFLLQNGYEVGSGVTGGSVSGKMIASDSNTRSIHSYYTVDAIADTVTVPIVEAQPYRWVDVRVDDAYCISSTLTNGEVGTSGSGSGDREVLFLALDELTATLNAPGYELEAVSGCTLRWEKDEYGKLIYRIIPDAAGDTSVEVRVIEAGNQPPVLKAGTDVGADVQTDKAAAEGLLKAAIDEFAKGSVPVGMSADTAEKLNAALEEADAVTVPELSAVLRVKQADAVTVEGAAAVYEIGIVLSVNGEEVGSLTELAQTVSIGLPLPTETGRIVYVVRSHGGEQEKLASSVQDGVIRFATDRFSEFAIMSSNNLADAAVDPIPDQTWTGSELTPKVCVTITGPNGEEVLKEGVDYELVYRDNVEAGTAAVTIMGMGDFVGSSATATFRILATETSGGTTPPSGPDSTADVPETSAPAADIPETSASVADVPDTSAPAADVPDTSAPATDVPETNVPVVDAPVTGDETPLALYAGLLALSASGLAAILLRRKRQQ